MSEHRVETTRGLATTCCAALMRRMCAGIAIAGLLAATGVGWASETPSAASILQDLRSFRAMGSVLYVAAHPDDENTQLIAYLARGRNYRTAYLSVTRGDGGQNVLGGDFDEKLGVARTQELLAARRLDGGRQFFTRAIDFGFSKDAAETLRVWDRQQLVSDVVWIIRTFRPDVVVTRFSPQPSATHGQHTASAVLALDAFKVAGDAKAFPEQLRYVTPWQPKRILLNGRGGSPEAEQVRVEIDGTDPVSGLAFGELAGRSRAMHKTQGMGGAGSRGAGGTRVEYFQLLDGSPAAHDMLDGVDATWARVPGGAAVDAMSGAIIAAFDANDPSASVDGLLRLRARVADLPADPVVSEKRVLLDRILQACLGLEVETTIPEAEVVPGEPLRMHHVARVRSEVPVRWLAVRYPASSREVGGAIDLDARQERSRDVVQTLPATTPLTQPYWLREEGTPGMFRVDDQRLIGQPESPLAYPIEEVFEVGGQTLVIPDQPVQIASEPVRGSGGRPLDVIPPVSLRFVPDVGLFAPGGTRVVQVEISAARANVAGALRLDVPAGWQAAPALHPFRIAAVGAKTDATFTVTAPDKLITSQILPRAEVSGARYSTQRVVVSYPHIPLQLLQPPATLKAVSLNLAIRGRNVGYLPGAGDSVADGLREMGYTVTELTGADLTAGRLRSFDAVVIGVRAFNVRDDLAARTDSLFAYVESGGTVVSQYNRPNGLKTERIAPFNLRLSQDRVTDENAVVALLAPGHPVLNTPNTITAADFSGWVQERGVYFPSQWDDHFTPVLACSDAGEAPLKGGLLVAPYGRGYFVYTGLAFFRQLPAGVPGAYRLFANLVSLGRSDVAQK